tara:strand:- start:922 stop:1224 length:303 start_codon:yes stop_codon:yes gene_type:complete
MPRSWESPLRVSGVLHDFTHLYKPCTNAVRVFSTLDLKSLKPDRLMPAYGQAVKTPNRSKVEQVRLVKDELARMKQDAIDVKAEGSIGTEINKDNLPEEG